MPRLRPATDSDSEGIIALIERVYSEYPGCVLDVETEEPELLRPASSFHRFWVLEDDGGGIVGCAACAVRGGVLEMKKVYVDRAARGRGLGRRLIELVEAAAKEEGISRIELWSDTRFETAHAVYERLGYLRLPDTRDLHDLSNTTEYHYAKEIS